jgi:hypothetical protein
VSDDTGEHLRPLSRVRFMDSPVMRALIVLLCGLIGLGVGVLVTGQEEQRYESTVRLLIGPLGADRSTLDAAGLLSRTYVDVVTSREAVDAASAEVGVRVDPEDVRAVTDERSRVMLVTVTHDDPAVPPLVADALALDLTARLEQAAEQGTVPGVVPGAQPGQARILDPATDPAVPVKGSTTVALLGYTLVGALAGLIGSRAATAMLRRTVDEPFIERNGLTALNVRYDMRDPWRGGSQKLRSLFGLTRRTTSGDIVDELDLLAVNLKAECDRLGPYRSVAFVPVDDDPAAAEVVLNVAAAAARNGELIEFFDADSGRQRIIGLLEPIDGSSRGASISTASARSLLGSGAMPTGPRRWQIPEGGSLGFVDPAEVAHEHGVPGEAARLQAVTRHVPDAATLVVMAPPVGESATSLSAAVIADRIILLVRERRTHKGHFSRVLRALARLGQEPTAVLQLDVAAGRRLGGRHRKRTSVEHGRVTRRRKEVATAAGTR